MTDPVLLGGEPMLIGGQQAVMGLGATPVAGRMTCIFPDYTGPARADVEDPEFTAAELGNEHPTEIYRSTGATARLTVPVNGPADGVAIINTNAEQVAITIREGIEMTPEAGWAAESGWERLAASTPLTTFLHDLTASGAGLLWAPYPQARSTGHVLEIDLSVALGVVYAGVIVAGPFVDFAAANSLRRSSRDYSFVDESQPAGGHVVDRAVVRLFNIGLRQGHAGVMALEAVKARAGRHPLAWRLIHSTGGDDFDWVVYGALGDGLDSDYTRLAQTQFQLEEVL